MNGEFPAFKPMPRLFREIVVTEKIDGTNAVVSIGDDGSVRAGSRNRWLTVDSDNYGFARWVANHEDELRQLGHGNHYGEWFGSGIQRRYGLSEKRFALFNVQRWHQLGGDPINWQPANPTLPPKQTQEAPACCHVVPILYRGPFELIGIRAAADRLWSEGSVAVPGWKDPEGLVVCHVRSGHMYKFTLDGDGHKGKK